MSYKHLAGRLVETQRSMLGQPAIEIAQSIDGLTVTDDGNVTSVDGDGRETIDELVERYSDVLGGPARERLRTAATEFEGELDLPSSLGGPGVSAEGGESDEDEEPSEPPGTPIKVRSPRGPDPGGQKATAELTAEATVEIRRSMRGVVTGTTSGPLRERNGSSDAGASLGEPVIVNYTTPGNTTREDYASGDVTSVFLLIEDEDDWQSPITVQDAVLDAVAEATDLRRDDLGDVADYVDPDCVLSVLGSDGAVPISFEVEGLTVTLHPGGMLQLH
jgi:hypothetical protein